MILLTTPRLVLRRFDESDAQLLFDLDRDPDVTRFTGPGLETVEKYRHKIVTEFFGIYAAHAERGFFAVEDRTSGEFIGWFLLRRSVDYRLAAIVGWTNPGEVEVGYRLKKRFWGKGLATEGALALKALAFQDPVTTALVACALIDNRASTRVMEKLGMTKSGRCELPDGLGEAVTYSLVRK